MVKRKNSTDAEKKNNKKSKSFFSDNLSTQEAIEKFEQKIVNNLIDLSKDDEEKSNPLTPEDDSESIGSDLDDCFTPNLPSAASVPIVITDNDIPEDSLAIIMESIQELKNNLNDVVKTNNLLSLKMDKVLKCNKILKKKARKQEKLTKVAVIQVVKLKRKNKKLLRHKSEVNATINNLVEENNRLKQNKEHPPPLPPPNSLENENTTYVGETLINKKDRVVPKWRQAYFRRRDEFKREHRNRTKAQIYKEYIQSKFLPRKYRPKFARTAEEYRVKEQAALKSLEASMEVCLLDADQAYSNFNAIDDEVWGKIQENAKDEEEVYFLQQQWLKEVSDAEVKGKQLCEKEMNFLKNLPNTDQYKGFEGVSGYFHHNKAENRTPSTTYDHNGSTSTYNQQYRRRYVEEPLVDNTYNPRQSSTRGNRYKNHHRNQRRSSNYSRMNSFNHNDFNYRFTNNDSDLNNNYSQQNFRHRQD